MGLNDLLNVAKKGKPDDNETNTGTVGTPTVEKTETGGTTLSELFGKTEKTPEENTKSASEAETSRTNAQSGQNTTTTEPSEPTTHSSTNHSSTFQASIISDGLNPEEAQQADVIINDFKQALNELNSIIDDDERLPFLRDSVMNVIQRVRDTPHLSEFLYENEDQFAIAMRALYKLYDIKASKSSERRAKTEKKANAVAMTMAVLDDLEF